MCLCVQRMNWSISYKNWHRYTIFSDFFVVSQSDAKEQYEKADEFLRAIGNYLIPHNEE